MVLNTFFGLEEMPVVCLFKKYYHVVFQATCGTIFVHKLLGTSQHIFWDFM